MSSIRKTLNRSRTTRVERMLLRGDNLALRQQTLLLTRDPFYMTEDRQVVHFVVDVILQFANRFTNCIFTGMYYFSVVIH